MKKIMFFLFILLYVSISFNGKAQKYNRTDEFSDYFTANITKLDPIEGLWYLDVKKAIIADRKVDNSKTSNLVAIIKETDFGGSLKFKAYYIENDVVSNQDITIYFTKEGSNTYIFNRIDQRFNIISKETLSSIGNSFEFAFDLGSDYKKALNIDPSVPVDMVCSYNFRKFYPTAEDIRKSKDLLAKQNVVVPSHGTGFLISSNGFIVTCYHVVENSKKISILGINGNFNKPYVARIVSYDKNNDLALLSINDQAVILNSRIPYKINTTSSCNVGADVFTLGYPLVSTMGEEIKLSTGIISSKSGFKGDITKYQISNPIQPGNSGSPLFDESGNLVGVITSKHEDTQNVGYAIKSNYLDVVIESSPETMKLPTVNLLLSKKLSEKVILIKDFIYIIKVE